MADVTAQTTTLRKGQFHYSGYLVTPPRTTVLEGTITATATYPALQVTYTLTSGSAASVRQDMTVVFTSSAGVEKAVLRVASGQSITSTVLPVNEFSRTLYEVTIGDKFKVYREDRIWDRLVSATAALNKDSRIAYTNQLADPVPVCNSGGPYAGFGTSVSFSGDTSMATDPDSAGSLTHAWDFIDATPPTSTAENPTGIVFPVGFREVKHTVTDPSNAKSSIQYVPVWVVDKTTYPPLRVQMDSLNDPLGQPARISFKLPYGSEGDITTLPDGAPIVYFEREYRKGIEGSYGSNVDGRSHVKFAGYLVADSIVIDADQNEVTFEAVNALGILENTPALPQLMVSTAAPTKWSEVRGLTTREILWYLSYWGSTLQTSWDFVWVDGLDTSYARIATEAQNIAEQLRDIANGINVQVTCDALGRIQFVRDPDFMDLTDRAAKTVAYNFATADLIKVEIRREHRGNTKFVEGQGVTPANAPVFAHYPGAAPAPFGPGTDTLAKQIVLNQTDINRRTVLRGAQLNGTYKGRFVPKGVRLTVPDGYDVIQSGNGDYVTLTLPASTNTRGISFTDTERWKVVSRDITYDNDLGAKDIVYTIDHETYADWSNENTYIPPQESSNGLPDSPPLALTFPELGLDPTTGIGIDPTTPTTGPTSPTTKNMSVFSTDNTASFTGDLDTPESSGGPDWTTNAPLDLTGLSGWGGGDLIAAEGSPFSPAYLGTGEEVNGFLLTDEAVQRLDDLFGTPALETANVFADASATATLAVSRSVEGFAMVARWVAGDGVYAVVTTDNGDTWDEVLVTAFENTAAAGISPGVWLDPHTDGRAYISVWTVTGDNTDAEASIYKTVNYGAAWSHLTSPDIDTGVDVSSFIGIAFDNAPGNRIYHRKKAADGAITLMRNAAGTEIDVTPSISSLSYVPVGLRLHEIAIPDDDETTLAGIFVSGFGIPDSSIDGWDIAPFGNGIITSVVGDTMEVEATLGPEGYEVWPYNPSGGCSMFTEFNVLTGAPDVPFGNKTLCGDDPTYIPDYTGIGLALTDYCMNGFVLRSPSPWTAQIVFDPCGDSDGELIYAFAKTDNALAETPTWDLVDSGAASTFNYRQVIALGSGKYLLYGENGAIGMSNGTTGIDSRHGDLSTTGEIIGTIGA